MQNLFFSLFGRGLASSSSTPPSSTSSSDVGASAIVEKADNESKKLFGQPTQESPPRAQFESTGLSPSSSSSADTPTSSLTSSLATTVFFPSGRPIGSGYLLMQSIMQNPAERDIKVLDWASQPGSNAQEVILWAIRWKNKNVLETLLGLYPNPNFTDDYGMTPLHYAVYFNNIEAVTNLLEHQANPNHSGGLVPSIRPSEIGGTHPHIQPSYTEKASRLTYLLKDNDQAVKQILTEKEAAEKNMKNIEWNLGYWEDKKKYCFPESKDETEFMLTQTQRDHDFAKERVAIIHELSSLIQNNDDKDEIALALLSAKLVLRMKQNRADEQVALAKAVESHAGPDINSLFMVNRFKNKAEEVVREASDTAYRVADLESLVADGTAFEPPTSFILLDFQELKKVASEMYHKTPLELAEEKGYTTIAQLLLENGATRRLKRPRRTWNPSLDGED